MATLAAVLLVTGCESAGERVRLAKENQQLRDDRARLERTLTQRDGSLVQLRDQLTRLQQLGPDRPFAAFAPVRIEIASLSGGADFDGKPGHDGVRLYIRPIDADGDVVKVPGRIRVQLLDESELGKPRLLGLYVFDKLDDLRRMWHGKFLTQHFTVDCPFPPGTALPASRSVTATLEFSDYLSGAVLAATKRLSLELPDRGPAPSP
ncbi:MAG TPA: hypothetical protein PKK06_06330 [Phycisphaerae bacterium]|nr:hypothetical protein [Phycisphaerae bacterium]HNU44537.1 hypothetical protein [Phycisphaerae bacterium]